MRKELNGVSFPFGGISWDNNATPKDKFRYLLLYLETKRILTNPACLEIKEQCIESVLEIKHTLVEITKDVSFSNKDISIIRSMITACNNYLNSVQGSDIPHFIYKNDNHQWADASFDLAMKTFRDAFKESIQKIEKKYKLHFLEHIPDDD